MAPKSKANFLVETTLKELVLFDIKKSIKRALAKIITVAVDPSSKPPKKWWDKMYKKVKKNNPGYSDETVRATIGKIWYHRLTRKKKSEIRKREGKRLK